MRNLIAVGLLGFTLLPLAAMANDCAPQAASGTAPAAELASGNSQLGAPAAGLAGQAGCTPAPADATAYKPATEHDNTPWRFDMSQGGKRMTADEFDAWMKARGVRVARGAPAPAAAAAPATEAAAAPSKD
ncbi:hypothetical protein Psesu_2274 [Pseudoxanthomonas suwonensis 11-1]|uniref:Secreted protein n=1 Tax=Pseudoxanthomonas suwonensis (strain 11-1) TaxID=743721 RepID=E6WVA9_PSEUU|nr:hypothetical protein [Pseudoxanthomonas suwonensis]ADV28108.1 hypothetical protein Psesu_2274 [Pseudoxanthomonas suwonensis 11-1]